MRILKTSRFNSCEKYCRCCTVGRFLYDENRFTFAFTTSFTLTITFEMDDAM